MKKLIYQVSIGNDSKLYDHCTESVKSYAKRIGATYKKQISPILFIKPNPFTTNRSKECISRSVPLPIFEKENAFDHIEEYDQIAIIDSDVYIRDNAPDIFESWDYKNKSFGAVVERDMPITHQYVQKIIGYSRMQYSTLTDVDFLPNSSGFEFMNMGVMIISCKNFNPYLKGQNARQFLERPEFQRFIDGVGPWKWSTDQTLLNWWIRKEKMNIERLDWRWNGLYSANSRIKECHFVHFFLKDKLPNRGENVKELMDSI